MIWRIVVLWGMAFAAVPANSMAAETVREIKMTVAVTPGFQALPDWKSDFERRVAYATRLFESEFKIKLRIAQYVAWQPPDETAPIESLLAHLRGTVPFKETDLVIGLAHYAQIPEDADMRDLHTIGQARPFTGHMVIRYPMNKLYRVQEDTVLVHELGHVFGAIHTGDRNSIMAPTVDRQLPSKFDPLNREIIGLTRGINFQKGAESLPPGVLDLLLRSYLKKIKKNESPDFFYSIGLFYLQLGQPEDAVKAWKTAVVYAPEDPELRYHLGMLYHKTGKADLALRELSQAVSGLNAPGQKKMKATALSALGGIYFKKNNLFAASNAWSRALALTPKDLELQTNLALIQMKQGQLDDSIRVFERVLKEDPKNLTAMRALGSALSQSGKTEEGLVYLESALSVLSKRPSSPARLVEQASVSAEIGAAYIKLQRTEDGLRYFRQACELAPSQDCHKQLGMRLYENKLWAEAARELAAAIQTDKENADLYGLLGTALTHQGDLTNAASVFREGLRYAKTNSSQARLRRNLGNLYITMKRYDLAEPEFRMALTKDWADQDSHFGLAIVAVATNQPRAAKESLTQVLKINPKNTRAQSLLVTVDEALAKEPSYA